MTTTRPTPYAHLHAPDHRSIRPGDRVRDLPAREQYLATPPEERQDGHAYPGAFYHGTVREVYGRSFAVVLYDDGTTVTTVLRSDLERI